MSVATPTHRVETRRLAGRQAAHQRRDIQGLRAVAVLGVVLFHAGLWVHGGFVGVDVFFVISGFVITAMLRREWEASGGIRLGQFYLRRFRRLTPALAVTVAFTMIGSALVLSPLGPQQTASKTGLGAMLISANFVISRGSGGYFDAPAASNPLLNMWSLSVEEQFYLGFPLLLLCGWAISRRWHRFRGATAGLVGIVALTSFGLALLALSRPLNPRTESLVGFYGPLSRAWEFAVGALLVLAAAKLTRLSRRAAAGLGLMGMTAIVIALFTLSESTPFPGPWTLLPVGGALLVLLSGAHPSAPVSRALSAGPMVKIGDWSYSIYLWHWPFIVFAKVLWPASHAAVVVAAAASLAPALASYFWVETPIRRVRHLSRRVVPRLVVVVVTPALVASVGVLFMSSYVWGPRLDSNHDLVAYHGAINWTDHDYQNGGFNSCTAPALSRMVDNAASYGPRCQQSKPGSDVDVALVGDSHVEHLFIGLMRALPHHNIMYFTMGALPTLSSRQYAAAVEYVISTPSIKTVLVNADWGERGVSEKDLAEVLRRLTSSGKRVFITDDVPNFGFSAYGCKYRSVRLAPTRCTIAASSFWHYRQPLVDKLTDVLGQVPGVHFMRTAHYLCDERHCSMTHGHDIFYADESHLNVLGSEYVARRMLADHPEFASQRGA